MFNQYYIDFADAKRTALKQYCKMENVLPESLVNTHKTSKSLKLYLETAAYKMLRRIDRRLDVMIDRLTADLEHNGMIRERLSSSVYMAQIFVDRSVP